jgi:hypothetical protein
MSRTRFHLAVVGLASDLVCRHSKQVALLPQPPAHAFWYISRLRGAEKNLHLVRVVCGHAGAAGLPPSAFLEEQLLRTRSVRKPSYNKTGVLK